MLSRMQHRMAGSMLYSTLQHSIAWHDINVDPPGL